jgi:hypothetical protein
LLGSGLEQEEISMQTQEPRSNWGLWVLVLALLVSASVSLVYLSRERRQTSELSATNQTLTATLTTLQGQLDAVNGRLTALQTAKRPGTVPNAAKVVRPSAVREQPRSVVTARPLEDSRLNELQQQLSDQRTKLADHDKDIADTRQEIEKARGDLQSNLDSAKTDLSGSIARTHDELVALQKRGERNYYEFHIDKSKQFQRVGPVSLSLRKANLKRKSYDVAMLVNDYQLQKKSVNLYEPVWVNLTGRPQPLELVVNQIGKNEIEGYISEPRYTNTDLGESAPSDKPAAGAQEQ